MTLPAKSFPDGFTVAVATFMNGHPLAGALSAALAQRGARVALIADVATANDDAIVADFARRESLETAFATAEERLGGIDMVVHAALPAAAFVSRALAECSDDQWQAACETALTASFHCLQVARTPLAKKSGQLIQIGPSLVLQGANGLVALSTAVEAQRGLAKSAARQWGGDGIRVNWIAVAAEVLSAELAGADLAKKSEAIPLPLGRRPDLDDVIAMIVGLAGEAGRNATGLTLNLDGGEWMTP